VRLGEFTDNINTPEASLTTALELIRHRYKDKKTPPKISTQSLINMVLNTDKNFDYDALVVANENNPALKNLIKSFNKDYVELRSADDQEDETSTTTNTDARQAPVDTVSKMAKRAGKKRNKSVY
jgi:hypothetical protein